MAIKINVPGDSRRVSEGATKTEASPKPDPLGNELAAALLRWRGQTHYASNADFLFAGDSGKAPWQEMILKDYIKPASTTANIGKGGWQTFGHSYRAWLNRFNALFEVRK